MRTRTSDNWKSKPGYFDVHHCADQYESNNVFGIPEMLDCSDIQAPQGLVPYNIRVRSDIGYEGLGIHFFLDDYRFENTWIRPNAGLERVLAADVALTPDFSLFLDFPRAVQIYNTYRNRWLGRFWQENGVNVIPTISWSDDESLSFAFYGVPKGSPVAISTVGIEKDDISKFMYGYIAMIEAIDPKYVICYGKAIEPLKNEYTDIRFYKSGFKSIKDIRAKAQHE